MTYTIKFTSAKKPPFTIADYRYDGPGCPNGPHTSLTLHGKGSTDYGESLWTNLVHMLENHCNNTAPVMPTLGQLWFNNAGPGYLNVYKINRENNQKQWYTLIDEVILKEKLLDPDFLDNSLLPRYVTLARESTIFKGSLEITGNLTVWGHIYAMMTPKFDNDVVNKKYLDDYIKNNITGYYVKLKSTTSQIIFSDFEINGKTTVIGSMFNSKDTSKNILDQFEITEYVTRQFVEKLNETTGLKWPDKVLNSVLSTDGSNIAFSKVIMDFICPKVGISSSEKQDKLWFISSNNAEVSWVSLDDRYVDLMNEQTITGKKTFNGGLVLDSTLYAGDDPGLSGHVLTSNGPDLPPTWEPASSGGTTGTSFDFGTGNIGDILVKIGSKNNDGGWSNLDDLLKKSGFGGVSISTDEIDFQLNHIKQTLVNGKPFGIATGLNTTIKKINRGVIKLPNNIMIQWIKTPPVSYFEAHAYSTYGVPLKKQYTNKMSTFKTNMDTVWCCGIGAYFLSALIRLPFKESFKSILAHNISTSFENFGYADIQGSDNPWESVWNENVSAWLFAYNKKSSVISQLTNNTHLMIHQEYSIGQDQQGDIGWSSTILTIGTY